MYRKAKAPSGTKEVLLLLPEDASLVDPFPFLETTLYYKSRSRTVKNLLPGAAREILRVIMQPGDVLYMPPWWWHEVLLSSKSITSLLPSARGVMGDLRMVSALGLEIPSKRLLEKLSDFQEPTVPIAPNRRVGPRDAPNQAPNVVRGAVEVQVDPEAEADANQDISKVTRDGVDGGDGDELANEHPK
eukprot:s783_g8.t3